MYKAMFRCICNVRIRVHRGSIGLLSTQKPGAGGGTAPAVHAEMCLQKNLMVLGGLLLKTYVRPNHIGLIGLPGVIHPVRLSHLKIGCGHDSPPILDVWTRTEL